MGQCTSCESQRRGTPAAGPNSPQIEFLPTSAFCLVSSATSASDQGFGHSAQNEGNLIETTEDGRKTPLQLTSRTSNLQPKSRSPDPDPLTNTINSDQSLPPPPPRNKGIRKVESKPRKYYRISPRNKSKSKVVTFSDPEVLDPVVKQSLISTSLRRIKFGKKLPPALTTTKLLPSPSFPVTDPNGTVNTEDPNTNTESTDMGNNSSNPAKQAAVTPGVRSYRHVPKSSTFVCNPKGRGSAISKQEDSIVPSSASANNILKSVNYNKVYNYEDLVNANKVPVSPQTLQDLNSSREEKKLLRDKFFSENSPSISIPIPKPVRITSPSLAVSTESRDSVSSIPRTSCSSSPSKIPVPVSNMGSIPRNGNRFPKTNNPVKEKRTFQYQPPSSQTLRYSSSATQVPKLYSTENVNGNINEGHHPVLKSRSQSATTIGITGASNPSYGLSNLTAQQQQRLRFPSACSYGNGQVGSGNTTEWKSGDAVFSSSQASLESGDFDPRRCSAPPKILTQRRNNFGLTRAPTKLVSSTIGTRIPEIEPNDGEDSRRHTLFGFNNKPFIKPIVPKKPIPTIPFFMLGPYGQSPPVTSTFKNGVSTGVVHQRKLFYQSQFPRGHPEPLKSIPIARSTTWVKEAATENISNLPKSQSTHLFGKSTETTTISAIHSQVTVPEIPDPVLDALNSHSQIRSSITHVEPKTKDTCPSEVGPIPEEARVQQEQHYHKAETDSITSKTSSSFTAYHDGSGTSTTSLNRSARSVSRDREHNVISDSEFLIDDEISDQPELTFTFKDSSSIILSPSSSEESLSSCDLMLDLTLSSRETRSSVPNIVSECKPAVVLPSPPEPNLDDLVSGIQELVQELKVLQGALEDQQKVDAEKDQLIERLLLENERLRKSKGRSSSGADEDTKESKKVSCNSEKERKPGSFHRRPLPPPSPRRDRMINAAAQTESPSKKKGITYPDEKNDKVGQLVSFRIGRRPAPASNGKL